MTGPPVLVGRTLVRGRLTSCGCTRFRESTRKGRRGRRPRTRGSAPPRVRELS